MQKRNRLRVIKVLNIDPLDKSQSDLFILKCWNPRFTRRQETWGRLGEYSTLGIEWRGCFKVCAFVSMLRVINWSSRCFILSYPYAQVSGWVGNEEDPKTLW